MNLDEMEPMNIYAKKGDKVVFLNRNGYSSEAPQAIKAGLIEGGVYTVKYVEVGQSMSDVTLEEFPDDCFNTVMFGDANAESDETPWVPHVKPSRYSVNMNASCKVVLTDFGLKVLLKYYNQYPHVTNGMDHITALHKPDKEGFMYFQLYELFMIFGSELNFGANHIPFMGNSIIMLDLVTEVPAKA